MVATITLISLILLCWRYCIILTFESPKTPAAHPVISYWLTIISFFFLKLHAWTSISWGFFVNLLSFTAILLLRDRFTEHYWLLTSYRHGRITEREKGAWGWGVGLLDQASNYLDQTVKTTAILKTLEVCLMRHTKQNENVPKVAETN